MDVTFQYENSYLTVNGFNLQTVCETHGTPCYLYSGDRIQSNLLRLRIALEEELNDKTQICFAMKANSNLTIIKFLADLNCGVDCVSIGEIQRALLVGIPPEKIVFSGVGKTRGELEFAVKSHIKQINVESAEELQELSEISKKCNEVSTVALRVNTKTDAKTHKYLSTDRGYDKFGISIDSVIDLCLKYQNVEESFLNIVGLSCHLGSQISTVDVFAEAFERMTILINQLQTVGFNLRTLDLGGGIGIAYKNEDKTLDLNDYTRLLRKISVIYPDMRFILEPGRFLIADSGCLLARVIRVKKSEDKNFLIIDAGMNDLIRPCLYQAYHRVVPVRQNQNNSPSVMYDVVGPVCESSDYFCVDTEIQQMEFGDYVAILNAGAYGFSMASRYNSRSLPAEVFVYQDQLHLIRERDDINDAISREKLLTVCCQNV